MSRPLEAFERACWEMRQEAARAGQTGVARLAKALAVALVGKLHAYDEVWEECQPDYNDPICGHWQAEDEQGRVVEYQAVAGMVSRLRRRGLGATAIPAIPAWVWSHGRVWLLDRMLCAGMAEVLYADTDGLVVTPRGYERLGAAGHIHADTWGELRLIAGPVEVEIVGPKMLRIGDELIAAGHPKAQRGQDFAADGFWFRRPFKGGEGPYKDGYFEEEYREM